MASKFGVTEYGSHDTLSPKPGKFAGATNTKRKAAFGITCNEPNGATFQEPCKSPAEIGGLSAHMRPNQDKVK